MSAQLAEVKAPEGGILRSGGWYARQGEAGWLAPDLLLAVRRRTARGVQLRQRRTIASGLS
eukprot:6728940-Prorocentrum_lima.AAC.2